MNVHRTAVESQISDCQTGLVYDEKLSRHYCAWNASYTERPERIKECYSRIQQLGLVERCVNIPVRLATDEEVGLCHSKRHMKLLKETQFMNLEQLGNFSRSYDYVYFHNEVEENARLALGGAIDLVDQVASGKIQNGMAVIRPPGHHAMNERYSGYCYFNNVAVAARAAMMKHGMKRILILDWDVHHGQGTQFDFYDDPRVMFISIHRYEHGEEWPHLRESDYDYTGHGKGHGYNINVPLNEIGCDNSDYLCIFFNIILPLAYEFQPELVLVSAGYDSAIGCPEGQMSVSPACFAHFVNLLKPLAAGKIALLLEGGYCLKTLAEGAALSLRALLGDSTPNIAPITQPRKSVVESILNTLKVHRGVHPCLAYQDSLEEEEKQLHTWQSFLPPQTKGKVRMRDEHPEEFPLIQDCCDDVSEATEQAILQQVLQLERDTVIVRTQHRLGLLSYHFGDSSNGKSSRLEELLVQKGSLSRCHQLPPISSMSELTAAVGAVMNDMVQTVIALPSAVETLSTGSSKLEDFMESASTCLLNDFDVKRTLFLSIGEGNQIPSLRAKKADGSSLSISLGLCSESDEFTGREHVSVPLKQLKDADLIAVFHQIVLPVAYEYGPEFLVVSLDMLAENVHMEGSHPSPASVGHVLALIQGLARGRLLLFVTPMVADQDPEMVAECVSVLNGFPCQTLAPCLPQRSTVELIKSVQDTLKATWKCMQFREKLPAPR